MVPSLFDLPEDFEHIDGTSCNVCDVVLPLPEIADEVSDVNKTGINKCRVVPPLSNLPEEFSDLNHADVNVCHGTHPISGIPEEFSDENHADVNVCHGTHPISGIREGLNGVNHADVKVCHVLHPLSGISQKVSDEDQSDIRVCEQVFPLSDDVSAPYLNKPLSPSILAEFCDMLVPLSPLREEESDELSVLPCFVKKSCLASVGDESKEDNNSSVYSSLSNIPFLQTLNNQQTFFTDSFRHKIDIMTPDANNNYNIIKITCDDVYDLFGKEYVSAYSNVGFMCDMVNSPILLPATERVYNVKYILQDISWKDNNPDSMSTYFDQGMCYLDVSYFKPKCREGGRYTKTQYNRPASAMFGHYVSSHVPPPRVHTESGVGVHVYISKHSLLVNENHDPLNGIYPSFVIDVNDENAQCDASCDRPTLIFSTKPSTVNTTGQRLSTSELSAHRNLQLLSPWCFLNDQIDSCKGDIEIQRTCLETGFLSIMENEDSACPSNGLQVANKNNRKNKTTAVLKPNKVKYVQRSEVCSEHLNSYYDDPKTYQKNNISSLIAPEHSPHSSCNGTTKKCAKVLGVGELALQHGAEKETHTNKDTFDFQKFKQSCREAVMQFITHLNKLYLGFLDCQNDRIQELLTTNSMYLKLHRYLRVSMQSVRKILKHVVEKENRKGETFNPDCNCNNSAGDGRSSENVFKSRADDKGADRKKSYSTEEGKLKSSDDKSSITKGPTNTYQRSVTNSAHTSTRSGQNLRVRTTNSTQYCSERLGRAKSSIQKMDGDPNTDTKPVKTPPNRRLTEVRSLDRRETAEPPTCPIPYRDNAVQKRRSELIQAKLRLNHHRQYSAPTSGNIQKSLRQQRESSSLSELSRLSQTKFSSGSMPLPSKSNNNDTIIRKSFEAEMGSERCSSERPSAQTSSSETSSNRRNGGLLNFVHRLNSRYGDQLLKKGNTDKTSLSRWCQEYIKTDSAPGDKVQNTSFANECGSHKNACERPLSGEHDSGAGEPNHLRLPRVTASRRVTNIKEYSKISQGVFRKETDEGPEINNDANSAVSPHNQINPPFSSKGHSPSSSPLKNQNKMTNRNQCHTSTFLRRSSAWANDPGDTTNVNQLERRERSGPSSARERVYALQRGKTLSPMNELNELKRERRLQESMDMKTWINTRLTNGITSPSTSSYQGKSILQSINIPSESKIITRKRKEEGCGLGVLGMSPQDLKAGERYSDSEIDEPAMLSSDLQKEVKQKLQAAGVSQGMLMSAGGGMRLDKLCLGSDGNSTLENEGDDEKSCVPEQIIPLSDMKRLSDECVPPLTFSHLLNQRVARDQPTSSLGQDVPTKELDRDSGSGHLNVSSDGRVAREHHCSGSSDSQCCNSARWEPKEHRRSNLEYNESHGHEIRDRNKQSQVKIDSEPNRPMTGNIGYCNRGMYSQYAESSKLDNPNDIRITSLHSVALPRDMCEFSMIKNNSTLDQSIEKNKENTKIPLQKGEVERPNVSKSYIVESTSETDTISRPGSSDDFGRLGASFEMCCQGGNDEYDHLRAPSDIQVTWTLEPLSDLKKIADRNFLNRFKLTSDVEENGRKEVAFDKEKDVGTNEDTERNTMETIKPSGNFSTFQKDSLYKVHSTYDQHLSHGNPTIPGCDTFNGGDSPQAQNIAWNMIGLSNIVPCVPLQTLTRRTKLSPIMECPEEALEDCASDRGLAPPEASTTGRTSPSKNKAPDDVTAARHTSAD